MIGWLTFLAELASAVYGLLSLVLFGKFYWETQARYGEWRNVGRRFRQWLGDYAPIPYKRCRGCGGWFLNFRIVGAVRWGIPRYCSEECSRRAGP
jgi:hypothetical protein